MTSSFLCPTRSGRTVAASIEGNVQDTIQLKEITINAGSTVEGLIFLSNKSLSKVTKQGQTKGCQLVVALEGFESTVVAFPVRHDDSDFLYTSSFLSETTSESYSFLRKIEDEAPIVSTTISVGSTTPPTLDATGEPTPLEFSLDIPDTVPPSMKFVATGINRGNPSFPNKCDIKYRLVAYAINTRFQISKQIRILAQRESVDKTIRKNSTINQGATETIHHSLLTITVGASTLNSRSSFCGLCKAQPLETFAVTTTISNSCTAKSTKMLRISPKHGFGIELQDPNKKLLPITTIHPPSDFSLHVKLKARLVWSAQGRSTKHTESWELMYATVSDTDIKESGTTRILEKVKVEVPSDLRCSYAGHLIQIEHHVVVQIKCKKSGDVVATTVPIPVDLSFQPR